MELKEGVIAADDEEAGDALEQTLDEDETERGRSGSVGAAAAPEPSAAPAAAASGALDVPARGAPLAQSRSAPHVSVEGAGGSPPTTPQFHSSTPHTPSRTFHGTPLKASATTAPAAVATATTDSSQSTTPLPAGSAPLTPARQSVTNLARAFEKTPGGIAGGSPDGPLTPPGRRMSRGNESSSALPKSSDPSSGPTAGLLLPSSSSTTLTLSSSSLVGPRTPAKGESPAAGGSLPSTPAQGIGMKNSISSPSLETTPSNTPVTTPQQAARATMISIPTGTDDLIARFPQDAAERLKKQRQKVGRPEDPNSMSATELKDEKSSLKAELRAFDLLFSRVKGRVPYKFEKEPLRDLYQQYKQVRTVMQRVTTGSSVAALREQYTVLKAPAPAPIGRSPSMMIENLNLADALKYAATTPLDDDDEDFATRHNVGPLRASHMNIQRKSTVPGGAPASSDDTPPAAPLSSPGRPTSKGTPVKSYGVPSGNSTPLSPSPLSGSSSVSSASPSPIGTRPASGSTGSAPSRPMLSHTPPLPSTLGPSSPHGQASLRPLTPQPAPTTPIKGVPPTTKAAGSPGQTVVRPASNTLRGVPGSLVAQLAAGPTNRASLSSLDTNSEYAKLKAEKRSLQLKLIEYQDAFLLKNGRKVKSTTDKEPMRDEYERYRVLKDKIADLEASATRLDPAPGPGHSRKLSQTANNNSQRPTIIGEASPFHSSSKPVPTSAT